MSLGNPGTKRNLDKHNIFQFGTINCMFVVYNTQNLRIKQEMNVVAQWFCSFALDIKW